MINSKKNSRFGLSEENLAFIRKAIENSLNAAGTQSKVYVFGSRAKGAHREYSDLDLWIESDTPMLNEMLRKLRAVFEESTLPIKIDLLTPESCLPEFRESIMANRVLWFQVV